MFETYMWMHLKLYLFDHLNLIALVKKFFAYLCDNVSFLRGGPHLILNYI